METLTPLVLDNMEMGLDNPIHPVFENAKWFSVDGFPKLVAPAPILGDSNGFWEVGVLSTKLDQELIGSTGRKSRCMEHDVAIFATRFSYPLERKRLSMVLSL